MADTVNPDNCSVSEQPSVEENRLSNREVLEIDRDNTSKDTHRLILTAYGREDSDVSWSALRRSLKRLRQIQTNHKKNTRNRQPLVDFLDAAYKLPVSMPTGKEGLPRKRRLDCTDLETLTSVNQDLARDLHAANQTHSELQATLEKAQAEVLELRQYHPSRVNQKLKRKDITINRQRTTIQQLRKALKSLNRKVMPAKPVEVKKKPVEKITKVLQCINCAYIDYTSQFRTQEVNDLKNKIQYLENEKLIIEEQLQERDAQDSEIVQTKKNGKPCTDDLRNAIFMCFENGVPITKLEKVIRGVAKYLTNKDLSNFSDCHTCRSIIKPMQTLSKIEATSSTKVQSASSRTQSASSKPLATSSKTQVSSSKTPAASSKTYIASSKTQATTQVEKVLNTSKENYRTAGAPQSCIQDSPEMGDVTDIPMATESDPMVTHPVATQAHPVATQAHPVAKQAHPVATQVLGDIHNLPGSNLPSYSSISLGTNVNNSRGDQPFSPYV